ARSLPQGNAAGENRPPAAQGPHPPCLRFPRHASYALAGEVQGTVRAGVKEYISLAFSPTQSTIPQCCFRGEGSRAARASPVPPSSVQGQREEVRVLLHCVGV